MNQYFIPKDPKHKTLCIPIFDPDFANIKQTNKET